MITATGVSASTTPATRAAPGPDQRRTVSTSSATVAIPSTACGTSIDQGENPNRFAQSPIHQLSAGGLSTVMNPGASTAAKSQATGLRVEACTAAA